MTSSVTLIRDTVAFLAGATLLVGWIGGLEMGTGFAVAALVTAANLAAIAWLVRRLLTDKPSPWLFPALFGKTAVLALVIAWLVSLFPVVAVMGGFCTGLFAITLRAAIAAAGPGLSEPANGEA